MSILLMLIFTFFFSVILHILNFLFGLWDYDPVIYVYEREIWYEDSSL